MAVAGPGTWHRARCALGSTCWRGTWRPPRSGAASQAARLAASPRALRRPLYCPCRSCICRTSRPRCAATASPTGQSGCRLSRAACRRRANRCSCTAHGDSGRRGRRCPLGHAQTCSNPTLLRSSRRPGTAPASMGCWGRSLTEDVKEESVARTQSSSSQGRGQRLGEAKGCHVRTPPVSLCSVTILSSWKYSVQNSRMRGYVFDGRVLKRDVHPCHASLYSCRRTFLPLRRQKVTADAIAP